MALIPTLLTPKLSLRWAIPSLNVSTLAAFLRGVARVNQAHVYAPSFGFVGDEGLELSKAPSMQSTALSLPHFGSAAKVGEVFKNQCGARRNRPFSELNLTVEHIVEASLGYSLNRDRPQRMLQ
jgi:hypothetical protein